MRRTLDIRCQCGHRISSKEIIKQGIFMSHWKPLYRYVRYRCSRCRRVGETLMDHRLWDALASPRPREEATEEERARFNRMGPITANEAIEFARRLTRLRPSDVVSLSR
jgi:DNA-directed RNA polymerase subunit RPC12/RpoP